MDLTGRTDFIETWLSEMPTGLGNFDTYDQIAWTIKDRLKYSNSINVDANTKKIIGEHVAYYWIESKNEIILGVELQIKPQGLVISLTGKHPAWRGKPPFASDLYNLILQDNTKSLRIISDNSLSDEGYSIWQRLLKQGHKISVYDKENPGRSFITIDTPEDMAKYFAHDDTDFQRYQYVLSESGEMLGETRSFFHIRRHRELVPGLL